MAFVSPAALPQFSSPFLPKGNAVIPQRALSCAVPRNRPSTSMSAVEFQTYSGGIDRVSTQPYTITRYLFKNPPSLLTEEDKDSVIAAGLRQIFGNAYVMEEERAEFYMAESQFRCGRITAKEFMRTVAMSDTYRKRFFESVSQFRFIELNFKHFLGRAPLNQVEYSRHFKIFAEGGYKAEINSYFDDPEYDEVFGEDVMPFTRFRGTYAPINQFNRMCSLEGGFAGSDKNKPQVLVTSLAANVPTPAFTVADGLPSIPNGEHPSKKYDLPVASLERYRNELEVAKARCYQLQVELNASYAKLDASRKYINSFKAMSADVGIAPLYGSNFGTGAVKVFCGQYEGAPAGSWGSSGVDNINGPSRRPAVEVSKKEKQFERVKQLIVDLERKVFILEAEREKPALTPAPRSFRMEGLSVIEKAEEEISEEPVARVVETPPAVVTASEAANIVTGDIDTEADDSGIATPKEVVVSTKREFADVGKLPKELMEEMEAEKKAKGGGFLEGKGPKPSFPGDGSEMVIGG